MRQKRKQERVFNKLVRDRIPEIIASRGEVAETKVLNSAEYGRALINKLFEEARELRKSLTLEELADVQEVLDALTKHLGFSQRARLAEQRAKRSLRGGFRERIKLLRTYRP